MNCDSFLTLAASFFAPLVHLGMIRVGPGEDSISDSLKQMVVLLKIFVFVKYLSLLGWVNKSMPYRVKPSLMANDFFNPPKRFDQIPSVLEILSHWQRSPQLE